MFDYNEQGECIWEWKYEGGNFHRQVSVYEYNIHRCYEPIKNLRYYVVTYLDFRAQEREQKKAKTITEAFLLADTYYDAARDEILETLSGVTETDLWNEMEAEDLAEAKRIDSELQQMEKSWLRQTQR